MFSLIPNSQISLDTIELADLSFQKDKIHRFDGQRWLKDQNESHFIAISIRKIVFHFFNSDTVRYRLS